MTLSDAIDLALNILKQVMGDKLNSTNVEVMTMTAKNLWSREATLNMVTYKKSAETKVEPKKLKKSKIVIIIVIFDCF